MRLLDLQDAVGPDSPAPAGRDLRRVEGGLLVQDFDGVELDDSAWTSPTKRQPTAEERSSLEFAWKVCAAVKSNAIVLVKGRQLVGVGAGQMSRLDSVRIAVEKAGERSQGAVLASDAFFPFRDGPDAAAAAGVVALDPARWFPARQGNARSLRRAQHGHDPDRPPPLPALTDSLEG